jgi:hypothetical protein
MDYLAHYRRLIQQIINEQVERDPGADGIEAQLIFDTERDRYQLNYVGWQDFKRQFDPLIQLDIIDGKIWIQHNGTDESIAERLVQLGVPTTDIVIGSHSPFKRQFDSYATH